MKVIRASDIGAYLFCRRAWWYRLQGYTPENQATLEQGSQFHQRHGHQAHTTVLIRWVAYALFLLALALIVVSVLGLMFS